MEAWTLRFKDVSLERSYYEFRKPTFRTTDGTFLVLHIFINCMSSAFLLEQALSGFVNKKGIALIAFSLGLVLLRGAVITFKRQFWEANRTVSLFVQRLVFVGVMCLGYPLLFGRDQPKSTVEVVKHIVVRSGIVTSNLLACGMPLPMRSHLIVQLLTTASLAMIPGRGMCRSVFHGNDFDFVSKAWKAAEELLLVLGGAPLNHQEPREISPTESCTRLVVLLQVCVGMVLPTAVLWRLELSSRKHFLRTHGRPDTSAPPLGVGQVALFLAVGLSGAWTGLAAIGRMLFGVASDQISCDPNEMPWNEIQSQRCSFGGNFHPL
ncbi:hypothetical protein BSKO_13596 [Bryopsis sp. KO-2023]|nr:hypothetical protein BSKO_13596 [Bryopsis sp. KO-2023]